METTTRFSRWTRFAVIIALAGISGLAVAAADAPAVEDMRVSESAFFADDGREQIAPNKVSTNTLEPLLKNGKRSDGTRGSEQRKSSSTESRTPNTDFWFYTVDVELFADEDRDGYYHGIDLLFDADTYFAHAEVFAVVYLSLDGGPWIEYAETETFSIFGASSDDEYVIVTELLAGYPTGSYDILVELFDTWDGSFVADFGPENTSELAFLPLEDSQLDTPVIASTPIVVNHGGGGAADWLSVMVLGLFAVGTVAVRRRYRLQPAAAPALSHRGRSA
ncbi:MAG: choice-of-anchor H family protein [Gammaproteobacteria bacterium]|nr:choice-of-anchor H family protein [Gammaproteobacteria bacterium]